MVGDAGEDVDLPGARRVPDARPGKQGPLAGLEAGLRASSNGTVFVVAGDMPFLSGKLAIHLCERVKSEGLLAAVPVSGERVHPLCAAYRVEILEKVSVALDGETRSMKSFLSSLDRVEYIEKELERFGDPEIFLMNVNSPEDLERAWNLF